MRARPSLQIVIIFPILPRFIHNSVYYTNLAACLKQFCMIFSSITQKPLLMQLFCIRSGF